MILSDLKSYLSERKCVPIADLMHHFGAEPDTVRAMLDHFITRGRVQRLDGGGACGGCNKCDAFALEFYTWVV